MVSLSKGWESTSIQRCIANSEGLTARLSGSCVAELPPQLFTRGAHLAPQNAPQIASCAVFSRRLALSLVLVKAVCRHVASAGEKRLNTFTRLRQFTADLRCGHGPEDAQGELFDAFTTKDIAQRLCCAGTVGLRLGDERDLTF